MTHGRKRKKGEKVEPGIWKALVWRECDEGDSEKGKEKKGVWSWEKGDGYIAETTYIDPRTSKRKREWKSFNRLDLARTWIQAKKTDAMRGEIRGRDKITPRPFDAFAEEYLEKWSKVKKKPSTFRRDGTTVNVHLKPHFGSEPIHAITRKAVEDFLAGRKDAGASEATRNRELCCLKNMLRKAVDWEYIEVNPAAGVKQEREFPKEVQFLSREEVARLVNECDPRTRPFVEVAVNTGLRLGEILRLEWRDVDLEKRMITVRETKNHETRYVPMNEAVYQVLSRHPHVITGGKESSHVFTNPDGTPYRDVWGGYEAALKRAGIGHRRIHDLRHTFASTLVMAGVDLRTVAKLMGHRTIQVTMRYAHLAPDHLRAAVERLDFTTKEERQEGSAG